ncbi:MAG TPA: DM13 domain-containing protein [Gemmatimonadales bacterium]|nr:DM13 domain-containing protein [Gemmatimonadales bacterium]
MTYRFGIAAAGLAFVLAGAPLAAQERDAAMGQDAMMKPPQGTFAGAEGHRANGSYQITTAGGRTRLELGADFSVEKGPDVYVVLSPTEGVPAQGAVFLGRLRRFDGAQAFDLPAGTDLGGFSHVVLWCKKYSVAMGTAPLATADAMMAK